MSVNVNLVMNVTARETLTTDVPAANNPTIIHSGFDETVPLNANTTPPVTLMCAMAIALVAGSAAIDLTNLVGTNGAPVNGTGLQVRAFKIIAPSGNGSNISVAPSVSNGYNLFGSSSGLEVMAPGSSMMKRPQTLPAVASGAKNITLTGTGTDSLEIMFFFG